MKMMKIDECCIKIEIREEYEEKLNKLRVGDTP